MPYSLIKSDWVSGELYFYDHSGNQVIAIKEASLSVGDSKNIALGTTTGTKIGTAASQKLGFFNVTPVAQQAHITDAPAGGTGATAGAWDTADHRDAAISTINSILTTLETFGLVATS